MKTINMSFRLTEKENEGLEYVADKMHISKQSYMKILLHNAIIADLDIPEGVPLDDSIIDAFIEMDILNQYKKIRYFINDEQFNEVLAQSKYKTLENFDKECKKYFNSSM